MKKVLEDLSNSKVLLGCALLLSNVGGKYISMELSKREDKMLQHPLTRRVIVFLTVLLTTRDILVSVLITLVFLLLTSRGKLFEIGTHKTIPERAMD